MDKAIITVGHSNHEPGQFIELLRAAGVEHLVDVRSQPYSRFAPHFNLRALGSILTEHGIEYSHDPNLGGRPEDPDMYDGAGHVLYGTVAASDTFKESIRRLETAASSRRLAIMCGEEDPSECHRRLLVGKVMAERGWSMIHLRGDGELMSEEQLADLSGGVEPGLFEEGEFAAWRSTRSVSPRNQPSSSSDH